MTDQKDKSAQAGKLVTSLAAGVALGAATVYLSDKKNQKKVAKKLDEVRAWSDKTVAQWKEKNSDIEEDVHKLSDKGEEEVKENLEKIEKNIKVD